MRNPDIQCKGKPYTPYNHFNEVRQSNLDMSGIGRNELTRELLIDMWAEKQRSRRKHEASCIMAAEYKQAVFKIFFFF